MNVGAGIGFLLVLFLIGATSLIWGVYWTSKHLRFETTGNASQIRRRAIISSCLLLGVIVSLPPFRRIGVWTNEVTHAPLPKTQQLEVDREWFGYIPKYGWVGSHGQAGRPDVRISFGVGGGTLYSLDAYKWVID